MKDGGEGLGGRWGGGGWGGGLLRRNRGPCLPSISLQQSSGQ